MSVLEIKELTKKRCLVILEQEESFPLYHQEIREFEIRVGEEIKEENYRKIMTEVLPRRLLARSGNLLKSRDYTVSGLRLKLQQGGYPENLVEDAVNKLLNAHYLDDRKYAENYISYYSSSRSRQRIKNDLMKKGVSPEIITVSFDKMKGLGDIADEKNVIEKVLQKKKYSVETATYEETVKMYHFLYRKGFGRDAIRAVLRHCVQETSY